MKRVARTIVPLALSLAAGLVMAQEAVPDLPVASSSSMTRAQVQAEARAAQAAGLIAHGEIQPVQTAKGVGATREQVRAELAEARRLGLVAAGEIQPVATPQQAEQVRLAGARIGQIASK